jgi:hypothetical protein
MTTTLGAGNTLNTEARLTRAEECVSADLGGQMAILHPGSGMYFGLNAVGATIWEALGEPATRQELCARVMAEYSVSEEQCAADVARLIDSLLEHGLVKDRDE